MKRNEILDSAMECVMKDRAATHGEAEDNFNTIADLWNAYLKSKGLMPKDKGMDGKDTAVLMILMKVSRLVTSPEHSDHWVDIAGYSACGGSIATKEKVRIIAVCDSCKAGIEGFPGEYIALKTCPNCGNPSLPNQNFYSRVES